MTRIIVLLLSVALPVFPVTQAWASCCPLWGDDVMASKMTGTAMAEMPPCHGEMRLAGSFVHHDTNAAAESTDTASGARFDHAHEASGCCHAVAGLPHSIVAVMIAENSPTPFVITEQRPPEPGPAPLLRPPSIG